MTTFDFKTQLTMGNLGEVVAQAILRNKYHHITDYSADPEQQKRGIDLYVEGLGYVEVKTDTHDPKNLFFETDVGGKPGAIDSSCADYLAVVFIKHRIMYLIPRPALSYWLRNNVPWIIEERPAWVKTITSRRGKSMWQATGIIVPIERFLKEVNVITVAWGEDEERIAAEWKTNEE